MEPKLKTKQVSLIHATVLGTTVILLIMLLLGSILATLIHSESIGETRVRTLSSILPATSVVIGCLIMQNILKLTIKKTSTICIILILFGISASILIWDRNVLDSWLYCILVLTGCAVSTALRFIKITRIKSRKHRYR